MNDNEDVKDGGTLLSPEAETSDTEPMALPEPKTAWEVIFAAIVTRTVQAPVKYYSVADNKQDALKGFVNEMKTDYGATEVKVLRFEEIPLDLEALKASGERMVPPTETVQ